MKKVLLAAVLFVGLLAFNSCSPENDAEIEKEYRAIEKGLEPPTNGIEKGTPPPGNG